MTATLLARRSRAKSAEDLFFELALADLTRAADLLRPVFARTDGVDGWVSLEVSPLLAHDTQRTIAAARDLQPARRQVQSLHQNSRHQGGIARDRGRDLRRRSGQCHTAIFAGAICRRGRSLSARGRAAHRSRSQSRRRLGRIALCQPLGCRDCRKGPGRTDQSARHRRRPAHLQSLSASCSLRHVFNVPPTPAPARNASFGPAPAPRIRKPPTYFM